MMTLHSLDKEFIDCTTMTDDEIECELEELRAEHDRLVLELEELQGVIYYARSA